MFEWNDAMISYMDRAARHTLYYKTLAEWIGRDLKKTDRICDAGCGLGYLSLALSHYVSQVDAVDSCRAVLHVLRRNIEETHKTNIKPIHTDIYKLSVQKPCYDAMIFCYFGKIQEIVTLARQRCKGSIYIVKGRSPYHLFSRGGERAQRENAEMAAQWLEAHQIQYEQIPLDLELGQPFLSLEDAKQFADLYGKPEHADTSWLEKRLGTDPRGEYKWYMPIEKPVVLFHLTQNAIEKGEL